MIVDGLRMRDSPSTERPRRRPPGRPAPCGRLRPLRSDFGPVRGRGPRLVSGHPSGRPDGAAAVADGPITSGTASAGSRPVTPPSHSSCSSIRAARPRPVNLAVLEAMLPWEHLAVLRNRADHAGRHVRLRRAAAASSPGTFEPSWLAFPFNPATSSRSIRAPGSGRSRCGSRPQAQRGRPSAQILRIVGHFDDPAARIPALAGRPTGAVQSGRRRGLLSRAVPRPDVRGARHRSRLPMTVRARSASCIR